MAEFADFPELPKRVMKVTQEEMNKARLPLADRDYCAHMLIPLNKCRAAEAWLPWKCEEERHAYEKCQYEDYVLRQKELILMRKKQQNEALTKQLEKEGKSSDDAALDATIRQGILDSIKGPAHVSSH
mmetsp:Transcript_261/g.547  ORF Transcript_261/g.547 Transcript_261/m.547 type:complete len:128 (-) Transcript_261:639-1022(-)|eukprot:CAMPEP_0196659868 /NCGR_PEP_ID=MMETSP1086-20130531/36922_1 /TAXON_ID=77921 /ORGANISM="Cyanoptyche  gloeocystis , Strain SAG4.97" /LENGTH=127 /DNA_ID=CAMNT_0041994007 /DNA_START=36 /DNA_END=419 /DNA_ORIENTATION=+